MQTLQSTVNPYGNGGASHKIVQTLRNHDLTGILKKSFYDIEPN
jgi:GDP/UDP-N,N'-diacetylbacillosamine 2-epimerase (hydrolysing)